ncbi:hypothetical protein V6N11_036217 [Hibiscus sabdariffa]|uniref:Uncharacterized protein n=1 Tax=Hibiscus sabdariffa TaxID=183260 RepID=A0ABR2R9R7_9ROSI
MEQILQKIAAILDDLDCMGFSKKDLNPSNEVAVESDVEMVHESVSAGNLESWAKGVNSLNNPKNKGLDEVALDEAESVSVDFTLKNANVEEAEEIELPFTL